MTVFNRRCLSLVVVPSTTTNPLEGRNIIVFIGEKGMFRADVKRIVIPTVWILDSIGWDFHRTEF